MWKVEVKCRIRACVDLAHQKQPNRQFTSAKTVRYGCNNEYSALSAFVNRCNSAKVKQTQGNNNNKSLAR